MKNLLILGSLPENDEDYRKYEIIIKIGKKYFDNILSPIDTKNFIGSEYDRFNRAVKSVKNADFIIGELSSASTGMGIEIGIAYELKIPIIILAKKGSKVSGLIKGNKFINEIIFYNNLFELEQKLENIEFVKFKKKGHFNEKAGVLEEILYYLNKKQLKYE